MPPSSEQLVSLLKAKGVLKTPEIEEAFRAVDRRDFVLPLLQEYAYEDRPLPIGYEQTISQPSVVAFMLELLQPEAYHHILDVGSGSGYTTALLGYIAKKGRVIGVERLEPLVLRSRKALEKYNLPHVEIREAHPDVLGLPEEAPFHRILVSADAKGLPKSLLAQLTEEGIAVIPAEDSIFRVTKKGKYYQVEAFPGFRFVPLEHPKNS